jgi:hypothetical protein
VQSDGTESTEPKKPKRRWLRARDWETLIRAFERSGLTQAEFAEAKGVSVSSLQRWLAKFGKPVETAAAAPRTGARRSPGARRVHAPVKVLPVQVVPPKASPGTLLELELPGGAMLRFAMGTDPKYISGLIAELRRVAAC